MQTEHTFSIQRANIVAILLLIPLIVVFGIPFYFLWIDELRLAYDLFVSEFKFMIDNLDNHFFKLFWFILKFPLYYFIVLLLGIFIHEWIHGVCFALFAKSKWKSVKFGVLWTSFTPYAHCTDQLKINHYRIAVIMPGLLLGLIPAIASLFIGNIILLIIGILFSFTAAGDFVIIYEMRKLRNVWIKDHPSEMGFYVIE